MPRIYLYDTTLREGTQSPLAKITSEAKLEVIRILDELGVDNIEAGFPRADLNDVEVMRKAKEIVSAARISGFARAVRGDIDLVREAEADIVQIFIPGSDAQLAAIMGTTWDNALTRLREATRYAANLGLHVFVAVTDAVRAREEIIEEITRLSTKEGAEEVVLADTVGVGIPSEIARVVEIALFSGAAKVGLHLHNDLGLATCNALAGIKAGAREVQVTIGGIGERLGNSPLEEVAIIGEVKGLYETGVKYEKLIPLVRKALEVIGVKPYPLKPVIGDYAFLHASDIHVYASLKYPGSFEPFNPEDFGGERILRFGKLTGIKAVKYALEKKGINLSNDEARRLARLVRSKSIGVDDFTIEDLVKILRRELRGKGADE